MACGVYSAFILKHMKQSFAIYDKNGIPILPGDTIKIYAYTAALRREKVYSYKYVEAIEKRENWKTPMLRINHLSKVEHRYYYMLMTGEKDDSIEIVQGYAGGQTFKNRRRFSPNNSESNP